MKYNKAINTFQSGELGRTMRSRFDLKEHGNGLEKMMNFLPTRLGGAHRRPSSLQHIFSEMPTFLVPTPRATYLFEYSEEERYLITANDITPFVSTAGFASSIHNLADSTWISTVENFGGTGGYPSGSALHVDISFYSTSPGAYHETTLGKFFILTDKTGSTPPIVIERLEKNSLRIGYWNSMARMQLAGGVLCHPYKDANVDPSVRLVFSVVGGGTAWEYNSAEPSVTMYAVDPSLGAVNDHFTQDDVGAYFRVTSPTAEKEAVVQVFFVDPTGANCSVYVIVDFDSTLTIAGSGYTSNWRKGYWNDKDGWPISCSPYQGRLFFGGNASFSTHLWASSIRANAGDRGRLIFMYDALDQDVINDDSRLGQNGDILADWAFTFGIGTSIGGNIVSLVQEEVLHINTTIGTSILRPLEQGILSATNFDLRAGAPIGASSVQAIGLGDSVLVVDKSLTGIKNLSFAVDTGKVRASDLSSLSTDILKYKPNSNTKESLTDSGVFKIVYDTLTSTAWLVHGNGGLSTITIDPETKTIAWSRHYLGDSKVSSGAAIVIDIFSTSLGVFFLVNRSGNITLENLERVGNAPLSSVSSMIEDGAYSADSKKTFTGASATVWVMDNSPYNIYYVDGTVLEVFDNITKTYVGEFTVTAGEITIPTATTSITVGIAYDSTLKTFPLEAGAQFGASTGNITRIDRVHAMLYDTFAGSYGSEENELYDFELEEFPTNGDLKLDFPHSPDRLGQVIIKSDSYFPLNVLGLVMRGTSYDG